MAYSHYLTSVIRALCYEVAPDISGPQARDALGSCLRTLAMIASVLERNEVTLGEAPDSDKWPAAINVPLMQAHKKGVHLPLSTIADDAPSGTVWNGTIDAAAQWVGKQDGQRIDVATLITMVDWERSLRSDLLDRAQAMTTGIADDANDATFINIVREDLEAYLRHRYDVPTLAIIDFRVIVGGRSRQTVLLQITGTDALPSKLVCQRDHPANINPNGSVAIQYRLLELLYAEGVKVPRPILFEIDRSVIGAPFMMSQQVSGDTVINPSTEYFAPPPRSERLACSLATQMAKLHNIDVNAAHGYLRRTLEETSSPSAWLREIEQIDVRWHALATGPSIAVEAAFHWLKGHAGYVSDHSAIVHTDMLLHNILVDRDEVSAVLDWEIAHIGHPAEDLGYVRPVIEQMSNWKIFMDAYRAAGGADISQEEIDWFSLRALLQLDTLAQFSRQMIDTGKSHDIRIAETGASFMPRLKQRLADTVIDVLNAEARRGASTNVTEGDKSHVE